MPPEKDALNVREEVSIKEIEYNVALARMQRAEELFKDKAISEKLLQEAQASLAAAKGALNASKARLNLLTGTSLDSTDSNFSAMILDSPFDGVLQRSLVAPGQMVAASTPLFEVAGLNPVWLRVSVYVGDLSKIDRAADVLIVPLGINSNDIVIKAKPVNGPPLSNPAMASSDLYYELMNEMDEFRIGQKVMAFLPLRSSEKNVIIFSSAVIYDMYGGSWVYVKNAPLTYERRRVEISHTPGNMAVITRGLEAGEEIAITAVAELYGTEFGGGK
jgi:RND family efflux transporter MFP subunit